ncbi:putative excisionase [Xenorhabdus poinarii G6]|uniref:Putative excisionase n=1 Tax=Xenorhabdus poinarii G6 TaxID=1354304 RepID=A0A068QYA9_9GAMM|nr:putative excisionase [Xenorhabdus poinarii G6]
MRLIADNDRIESVTLSRKQAAAFIGIDEDTLSLWCKIGKIAYTKKNPTKPKSPYLFTRSACIAAINNPIQTVPVSAVDTTEKGDKQCQSSVEEIRGMGTTRRLAAKELRSLLGQRTKSKLRSCTTEERLNYGA